MATRKAIPRRMEKALFQEVGSRCPNCGEDSVTKLTIHHIEGYSDQLEHDPTQMIVLCANCHTEADAGDIPKEKLYALKTPPHIIKFPGASRLTQTVVGDENIVAGGNITIRVGRGAKNTAMPRPAGTVCDDSRKVGYLQYLAKRYNQFREWDLPPGEPMKHGFIHGDYQRNMKYAIRTTPLQLFERGVEFLHNRILRTKLGRILNARDRRVFSSFDEFDGAGDLALPTDL